MNVEQANPHPCSACPWRLENQGKKHPDGWYTATNLKRLWQGLRTGEAPGMSCHPTDPRNQVSEAAQKAGYSPAREDATVHECAGASILMQRELMIWQREALTATRGAMQAYRRLRPAGLTRDGLRSFVMRVAVLMPGQIPLAKLDLMEPVGYKGLDWNEDMARECVGAYEKAMVEGS